MFKKIASMIIAATMLASTAAFATSAAETESAVAAEESAAVSAEESSEVGAGANEIYFDVKGAGWGNVKKVFCHIWKADGTGDWPGWQTKKELCKYDAATGIATYDLSKTGNTISKSDGRVYCVIFSANTGIQTYNSIMSGKCIGDTLYTTGNLLENPEDSEKTAIEAAWKNNKDCGAEKKVTSTGNIVGTAYPEGESDVTLAAQFLIQYYNDDSKTALAQDIINKLNVSPVDVMSVCKARLGDDPEGKLAFITPVLSACTDPTKGGATVDKEDLENVDPNANAGSSGSSNGGSAGSNGGSNGGSNSSGSSNSGSGSVQSGQETTIFFVFAGLMVAAAGVTFLARKKRA